ncbi:MAG: Ig-like domain-containing protein, partial [Gemmatimonadetes bacterium]|nr:Ig-like domain-containing protein [Gemmatimonadota bacterium]
MIGYRPRPTARPGALALRRAYRFPLLLLGLLVGCEDEPVGLVLQSGSLQIELVTAESAPPDADSGPDGAYPAPANPAGALSHLDSARVTVGSATTTAKTVTLTKGASGFSGTVTDLAPGSYNVSVHGFAQGELDYFGLTTSDVTVTAGQTATATIPWGSFVPTLSPLPASTAQFRFVVAWGAVTGADSYKVEIDKSSAFSGGQRSTVTTNSATLTVTDTGAYYLRVRSSNRRVAQGRASATQTINVVANPAEPADNNSGSATTLGFGTGASGTFGGLNIWPGGDIDWFAIGLCQGDSINVTAKAVRLTPPSTLNTGLRLYNPGDTLLVANDDADSTDARLALRVSREGKFKIRVASGAGPGATGYYELVVQVAAGPNQGVASCVSGTNVVQVLVTPSSFFTASLTGSQTFAAQARDAAGNTIGGKTANFFSLNPGIVTINSNTGVATFAASGQTTIAAAIDGVVGYAVVQVAAGGAAAVGSWSTLSTGQSQQLSGVWGFAPNETYVVVGAGGSILRYTGSSWSTLPSATTRDLNGVFGFTTSDFFAVGAAGAIVRNDAAGSTVMASGTTQDLYAVWGATPTNVFAVGSGGTILRYNGAAWSAMTSPTTQTLYGIWGGAADNNVFAVGAAGTVVHFNGSSWNQQTSNTTQTLYAVWTPGGAYTYAVGGAGSILRYGGTSWFAMTSNTTQTLYGVWGTSGSPATAEVYAVGAQGTVLRFDGTTWSSQTSGTTQVLEGVWGSYGGSVYAVGAAGTAVRGVRGSGTAASSVRVIPAGATLSGAVGSTTILSAEAQDANGAMITGKAFSWRSLDPSVATVSGTGQVTAQGAGQAVIAASTDGVTGYALVTVTVAGVTPVARTEFLSSNTTTDFSDLWGGGGQLFVAGADGRVRRYDGEAWTSWQVATSCCDVKGLWGLSPTEVYAVWGASVSRFDGVSWTDLPVPGAQVPLNDIWGSSPRDIHAVGNNGLAYHYDGNAWQTVPTGTTANLHDVWGASANAAYA